MTPSRRAFLASVAVAPVVAREMRATPVSAPDVIPILDSCGVPMGSLRLYQGPPTIEHGRTLMGWVYWDNDTGWRESWLP